MAKKDGDLYIASVLHVPDGFEGEGATKTLKIKSVPAGTMLSDADVKLDEKQVRQFKIAGVLRKATPQEQEAMDAAADRREAAEAGEDAASETALLTAEQQADRRALDEKLKADADAERAKLAEAQAKEAAKVSGAAAKTGAKK